MRIFEKRLAALEHGAFSEFVSFGLDGMRVKGGTGLTVEGGGSVNIADDGNLNVDGNLTVGGTAAFTGDTNIGGNLAVTGTLSLPAGIIDNDTLSDPTQATSAPTVTATGWSVGTSWATVASTSIAVPAGFSKASVKATASMHFQDSAANGGWCRAVIAGSAGAEMGGLANLNIGVTALHSHDMTGLAGGTITIEIQVRASVASSATTGRIAQINGNADFER